MLITPAYAQALGGAGGSGGFLIQILPFIAIGAIFYFLLIRPQQKRVKEHQSMVSNLRRGDTIVTAGGIIGKVTKVIDDNEVQVELAENMRVRVVRHTITEVRSKTEPVPANDANGGDAKA